MPAEPRPEDVELVAQAIRDANTRAWPRDWEIPAHWFAVGALNALADRLLPPGAVDHVEYAEHMADGPERCCSSPHMCADRRFHVYRRSVSTWPDGARYERAWQALGEK